MRRHFHVYILSSARRVLYVGVTNDLVRRVHQHRARVQPGSFTKRYNVTRLVYYELVGGALAAIAREKQIKGWVRRRKIALIESVNPRWRDLAPLLAPRR